MSRPFNLGATARAALILAGPALMVLATTACSPQNDASPTKVAAGTAAPKDAGPNKAAAEPTVKPVTATGLTDDKGINPDARIQLAVSAESMASAISERTGCRLYTTASGEKDGAKTYECSVDCADRRKGESGALTLNGAQVRAQNDFNEGRIDLIRNRIEGWNALIASAEKALAAKQQDKSLVNELLTISECAMDRLQLDEVALNSAIRSGSEFEGARASLLTLCQFDASNAVFCPMEANLEAYGKHAAIYRDFVVEALSLSAQASLESEQHGAQAEMIAQAKSVRKMMTERKQKLMENAQSSADSLNAAIQRVCKDGGSIEFAPFAATGWLDSLQAMVSTVITPTTKYSDDVAGTIEAGKVEKSMASLRTLIDGDQAIRAQEICGKISPATITFVDSDQFNRGIVLPSYPRDVATSWARNTTLGFVKPEWTTGVKFNINLVRDQTPEQLVAFFQRLPKSIDVVEALEFLDKNRRVSCAIPDDSDQSDIQRFSGCLQGFRLLKKDQALLPHSLFIDVGLKPSCPTTDQIADTKARVWNGLSITVTPKEDETAKTLSDCGLDFEAKNPNTTILAKNFLAAKSGEYEANLQADVLWLSTRGAPGASKTGPGFGVSHR